MNAISYCYARSTIEDFYVDQTGKQPIVTPSDATLDLLSKADTSRKMGGIGYGWWFIKGWLRHRWPGSSHTLVRLEQWDYGKMTYHGWRCWHCDYTEGEHGAYEHG